RRVYLESPRFHRRDPCSEAVDIELIECGLDRATHAFGCHRSFPLCVYGCTRQDTLGYSRIQASAIVYGRTHTVAAYGKEARRGRTRRYRRDRRAARRCARPDCAHLATAIRRLPGTCRSPQAGARLVLARRRAVGASERPRQVSDPFFEHVGPLR